MEQIYKTATAQKIKFFIKDFFGHIYWRNP